jgi:hypothetical protein
MKSDDLDAFAIQPWVMTGSDGSGGHPRKYATYPKAYQDMVVTKSLFSLPYFVYRSSGMVADAFYLCDRGYLRPGMIADIAIIDLDEFKPIADFKNTVDRCLRPAGQWQAGNRGWAIHRCPAWHCRQPATAGMPGVICDEISGPCITTRECKNKRGSIPWKNLNYSFGP